MIFYFLLTATAMLYQPFGYSAEGVRYKTISLEPQADLEYKVPENYGRLEGCVHRTFKMEIQDPKGQECTIIETADEFKSFVFRPLKPIIDCENDPETIKKVINFLKNPFYVTIQLKNINECFGDNTIFQNIGFITPIKYHTTSFKNNMSGNCIYQADAPASLPGLPVWPGDIILFIDSKLTKRQKIQEYKDNVDVMINTIFKGNTTDQKLYLRTYKNKMLDTDKEFDAKSKGKVIYLKDVLAYLSYLQKDVNSWNLQAAVDCFNNFTETGKMHNLPFWTLPRYQITAGVLLLLLLAGYNIHKKNKNFDLLSIIKKSSK